MDPAGPRIRVANAIFAGVCIGGVSIVHFDVIGVTRRSAVAGALECLAQVLGRFLLLGVFDSLADHSFLANAADSGRDTDDGQVSISDFRDLAFLPGNLRRLCALHTDRLDAQRQADFSLMRCISLLHCRKGITVFWEVQLRTWIVSD